MIVRIERRRYLPTFEEDLPTVIPSDEPPEEFQNFVERKGLSVYVEAKDEAANHCEDILSTYNYVVGYLIAQG